MMKLPKPKKLNALVKEVVKEEPLKPVAKDPLVVPIEEQRAQARKLDKYSKLTPKKVSAILLNDYLEGRCDNPWRMSAQEMSEQVGWNVTEKRREAVVDQLEKVCYSFKTKLSKIIGQEEV